MQISDADIVKAIIVLSAAIAAMAMALIHLYLDQTKCRNSRLEDSNLISSLKVVIVSLQAQVDALISGDVNRAKQMRDTDVYPAQALERKKPFIKPRKIGIWAAVIGLFLFMIGKQ